jgi:hypothetical protein
LTQSNVSIWHKNHSVGIRYSSRKNCHQKDVLLCIPFRALKDITVSNQTRTSSWSSEDGSLTKTCRKFSCLTRRMGRWLT